ncbi:nitrate- and nitrite sensing domain-containing protein [Plantactinospora sp. KLBMP9567]|uniref:sensor histidine kinase n=1 Tax=Plantactinospora sp. KLBMP9567 TaxID=3085900 RepID=UPI002980A4D1|nr:nitrate- and nitrite sensing domain-containing protein [Plantactinospora sp. KLBMP9567]MDW5328964.1 nitrate- and nitrite sensing domain-containing protein [Plantactinospora sp. KLBMP9567]
MGFRASRLRTKVVALLVTLTALWAFGAWVTLRDGLNLIWVQTLEAQMYAPSEPLVLNLQNERRLSLGYLGAPEAPDREPLETERRMVRADVAIFRAETQAWFTKLAARPELEQRVDEALAKLDGLAAVREAIDARRIDRLAAAQAFTEAIDTVFRMYGSLGNLDAGDIDGRVENLIRFTKARELASQADALLTGAYAANRISPTEYARVIQLIGTERLIADEAMAELPRADQARYRQALRQGPLARLRAAEDRIVLNGRPNGRPAVPADEWRGTIDPGLQELLRLQIAGGDEVVKAATPGAVGTLVRMLIMAILGLVAVVISVNTARSIVRQLERLREAALKLAHERLPDLVGRLGRGETVDVRAEAPPLEAGPDEIGQVAQAFNVAQETAVRTAVEQAELRRSVRDIFLSLARRTQALIHRQLTLLDAMERRENDPEELEDLFRVDHLATRMRRNAENLIVLSGSTPGRAWRRNVPMIDVLRGAVAEVEDYARVTVLPVGAVDLAGRAVGDVIHLLAELVENALSFSPPHTGVQVSGQLVANGYAVEIEDRGLGMSNEDRVAANERIATQHEFTLTGGAARLGLYVVSRLTERHGVRVRLKESPYGGTTAVVLLPLNLITDRSAEGEPSTGSMPVERLAASAIGGSVRRPPGREIGRLAERESVLPPGPEPGQRPGRRLEPDPAQQSRRAVEWPVAGSPLDTPGRPAGAPPKPDLAPPAPGLAPRVSELPALRPDRAPTRPEGGTAEPDARAFPGSAGSTALPGSAEPTAVPGSAEPTAIPKSGGPTALSGSAEPTARSGLVSRSPGQATGPSEVASPDARPGAGAAPAAGTGPSRPAGSASPEAGQGPASGSASLTPSGLPVRVRQANLAPPLRDGDDRTEPEPAEDHAPRTPEQIRRMMSSYQSGTRRGRSDAARPRDDGTGSASPED